MAPDTLFRFAPFVQAVGFQKSLVKVPHRPGADVLHRDVLEIGEFHLGENAPARLDMADHREVVPEGSAQALLQE